MKKSSQKKWLVVDVLLQTLVLVYVLHLYYYIFSNFTLLSQPTESFIAYIFKGLTYFFILTGKVTVVFLFCIYQFILRQHLLSLPNPRGKTIAEKKKEQQTQQIVTSFWIISFLVVVVTSMVFPFHIAFAGIAIFILVLNIAYYFRAIFDLTKAIRFKK